MAQECKDLPEECWELIINRLHRQSDLESVSLVCKQFLAITNRIRLHLSLIYNDSTLSKIILRFPNLNSIDLSDFLGDHDLVLFELANCVSYIPNLRQLDFSGQIRLPIEGLKEFGREFKGLRVLKCGKLAIINDSCLNAIAESFPFLEELDISYPRLGGPFSVADSGIEASSGHLRNLRKINISGNYGITDRSLVALSMNCLNLQAIQVEDTSVTLEGILSIQRACASLSWISVSKIHNGLGLATSSRSLQTLEVSDSIVTDELLFLLATASLPLSRLSLTKCTNFTLRGISFLLYEYRTLKCLSLVNVKFLTDESMNDLSQYLQSLVTINLGGCVKLTIYTFFTLARNCPSIEDVNMENTSIGMKRGSFPYGANKRIRSVCLANNPHLNDDSLTKVALLCPNMESLNVYRCRSVTEAGIAFALVVCNHIRNLGFGRCQLIKNIGRGPELPNLEVINAAGSALSDEGLVMIGSRCSRLLKLNLDNCEEVTAEGIQAMLQNCTSLREVNLTEECLRFVRA